MTNFFDKTPEELDLHRTLVKDWLVTSVSAMMTFSVEETGSFITNSSVKKKTVALTTPARAYMALASASRFLDDKDLRDWKTSFQTYGMEARVNFKAKPLCRKNNDGSDGKTFNNFEWSRFADFIVAEKFCNQPHKKNIRPESSVLAKQLGKFLWEKKAHKKSKVGKKDEDLPKLYIQEGQMFFDKEDPDSRHFFVTLHVLRAIDILVGTGEGKTDQNYEKSLDLIVTHSRQFCVEQCYFSLNSLSHEIDPARLTFACVLYVSYGKSVDKDLVNSVIEAISKSQRNSGKWPVTHPVIRNRKNVPEREAKDPWYIATHEVALSLSWLYFNPRVPDQARVQLLDMMDLYFRRWVIRTFRQSKAPGGTSDSKEFEGWYDDRASGHDQVVGWATATVCQFLANYIDVLNDFINRKVIESLDLQALSENFVVDENDPNRNKRFRIQSRKAVWPDLPPLCWPPNPNSRSELTEKIWTKWTDPVNDNGVSAAIAKKVLGPIVESRHIKIAGKPAGVLDGPPGTRKTSLIKTLASILKWPYIPVPASVIFERGFDRMEERATEVFRRLNFLTQCIVFFDEFEEFFRDRGEGVQGDYSIDNSKIHNRTIAAFTTSAMLPRMQDLRDEEKCLIFLATNHMEKIDSAIIRQGRFDYQLRIDHPTIERICDDDGYLDNLTDRAFLSLGNTPVYRSQTGSNAVSDLQELIEQIDNKKRRKKFKKLSKNHDKIIENLEQISKQMGENSDLIRQVRLKIVTDVVKGVLCEKNLDKGDTCLEIRKNLVLFNELHIDRSINRKTRTMKLQTRFSFVEQALRDVQRVQNDGANLGEMRNECIASFNRSIKPLTRKDGTGMGPAKGPPPLLDNDN